MKIERTSMLSGKRHEREIDVTPEQIYKWQNTKGLLIQDAFPHLSADDREFLMTGITPEEWDKTFKEDDDG